MHIKISSALAFLVFGLHLITIVAGSLTKKQETEIANKAICDDLMEPRQVFYENGTSFWLPQNVPVDYTSDVKICFYILIRYGIDISIDNCSDTRYEKYVFYRNETLKLVKKAVVPIMETVFGCKLHRPFFQSVNYPSNWYKTQGTDEHPGNDKDCIDLRVGDFIICGWNIYGVYKLI